MVVDAFYVQEPGVGKVTGLGRLEQVTAAVGDELGLSRGADGAGNETIAHKNAQ
jgi:hypothetical protein